MATFRYLLSDKMKKQELKRKIQDFTFKINQIKGYGGIVPDQMLNELEQLSKQLLVIQEEQDPLELKFREEYLKNYAKLQEDLKDLYKKMDQIIDFAKEHGIIFKSELRHFEDCFKPSSFEKKAKDLDYDFINKILEETECYRGCNDGWQQSTMNC